MACGKAGDLVEAHAESALEVGGEQQRKFRVLLQLVGDHGGFQRLVLVEEAVFVVDGEAESAEMILAQGVAPGEVLRIVDVEELGARPDHEHLADLLLQRHLLQRFLRPLFAGLVEMDGAGRLESGLAGAERGQARSAKQIASRTE